MLSSTSLPVHTAVGCPFRVERLPEMFICESSNAIPSGECKDRQFVCIFVWWQTVAITLMPTGQYHSYTAFINLGLSSLVFTPQLLCLHWSDMLVLVVVKACW